jgi:hypothetical protein
MSLPKFGHSLFYRRWRRPLGLQRFPAHRTLGWLGCRTDPRPVSVPDPTGDVAPDQSPVLFSSTITAGGVLRFSVTGSVNNIPFPSGLSPDGTVDLFPHFDGAQAGIANIIAPANSLIGLFLDNSQPDSTAAPGALDFSVIGLDFLSLSPGLKQPFFIGDGLGAGGVPQGFSAPAGATRLYLGTMDGYGWFNNFGSFEVNLRSGNSVPDGGMTAWLLALGLSGVAGLRRRLIR